MTFLTSHHTQDTSILKGRTPQYQAWEWLSSHWSNLSKIDGWMTPTRNVFGSQAYIGFFWAYIFLGIRKQIIPATNNQREFVWLDLSDLGGCQGFAHLSHQRFSPY
jgi:hypothetical protein